MPLLCSKITRILAVSRAVVVGNRHLADYARPYARRIVQIPTVVDVDKYHPREETAGGTGLLIAAV